MIEVIENKIPQQLQDKIENLLLGEYFPWFLNAKTAADKVDLSVREQDGFQFTHCFVRSGQIESRFYNDVIKLLDFVDFREVELWRIKANLTTNIFGSENTIQPIHTDRTENNFVTLLYYVNDSDGDTFFFENGQIIKKIKPVKGNFVLFNSNLEHAGSYPVKYPYRSVINFVFSRFLHCDF